MAGLSRDNVVAFRLAAQHLAARLPAGGLTRAAERAQLVRRYLHLYGPSTADDFAAWAGISRAFAGRSWSLVAAELDEVTFAGRRCFILSVDADRFAEPPRPRGVRLVPAYDAYLQGRTGPSRSRIPACTSEPGEAPVTRESCCGTGR